jgi:alkanesulfonate monooxygenase SsuD/methylene tetrahydromethanopterin reductase-like flavin-dependent oxidoreductase (luciferase family)
MGLLRFGWHMPSFALGNVRATTLVDQISQTLERIQGCFHSAWSDDHLHVWAPFVTDDTPALECLTTLGYLAAQFPQLHFGSLVICQAFRNPALLAKSMANLQLLSGGRMILGLGAGWSEGEFRAYGYEFAPASVRITQLSETVQIVRKLWTEWPASFDGHYYHMQDAYCVPQPIPLPPIMVGGGGEKRTLRVVAEHADWWNFDIASPAEYARKRAILQGHCDAVGRDEAQIVKMYSSELVSIAEDEARARQLAEESPFYRPDTSLVGTPEQVAAQLRAYEEVGVQVVSMRFADFPDTYGIELFAESVIPQFV